MMRKMEVTKLGIEDQTYCPVIVLKDPDGNSSLQVSIGLMEATYIASGVEQVHFPRPVIHDLLTNLFNILGVTVNWIEIRGRLDNTSCALIDLSVRKIRFRIDSRPSDAIAIALRTNSQIYVNEALLD
ncbi:MAG: bifunctional nuclease family protein [Deltaproteobacteria bacterium]|nr:bifunctional nuclease family protein [Deltaproteobacteria bacterium]